jgi:hypothetical protein
MELGTESGCVELDQLEARVRAMMEVHWRPTPGGTVPNATVYPWLWQWDSCFHALIWNRLGDSRALQELRTVFSLQRPTGFLPHMNYAAEPLHHAGFWGVVGSSTITQPPVFGHALATLAGAGHDVAELVDPARSALWRLLESRRTPSGLLRIVHPWESGIDDHPRWAPWQPEPWDRSAWGKTKGRLVEALVVRDGEAVANDAFEVCPAGFNALVAWDCSQLATVCGDERLAAAGVELADALDDQWDPGLVSWLDARPDGSPSSSIRTLDALLPALVTRDQARAAAALRVLADPEAYGLRFGPSGVHVDEPAFAPRAYGRGGAWPHLTYLLWRAAAARGHQDVGRWLAGRLRAGAWRSGLAEYWDPRTGEGLGARPQSWSGLALLLAPPPGAQHPALAQPER